MNRVVLDASAALAIFKHEPGDDIVRRHVPGSVMSAVNVAEVVGKLVDAGAEEGEVRALVGTLGPEIAPFDEQLAYATGMLHRVTRGQGLSLGDRACLALAKARHMPALTADRRWAELDIGVEVVLIRE